MPIINGSGQGGGNGSVWWSVEYRDPSTPVPRKPKYAEKTKDKTKPGKGEVMVDELVEGHDDVPFNRIGYPDHPGCFRVRLRFRYEDENKIPAGTRAILEQFGTRSDEHQSWFLDIDVPAIQRVPPAAEQPWPDMPWEIVWGW